ncbi:PAS domain S-box protein [candidate division WOR-3 bacterium]|nr:PAS domain S-box protein [candidate division WOR-3 bacterium]
MNKKILLTLRFVLILVTIVFMTYTAKGIDVLAPGYIIALIYLISNLIIYRIPDTFLSRPPVSFCLFIFDILAISAAIYVSQGIETDFYLVYFLVIFAASVGQNIGGSLPIAFVASIVYGWLIYQSHPGISFFDSKILIRIPFIFIISLMASYWSQTTRQELRKKKELERFNNALQEKVAQVAAREIELRIYNEKIINSVSSGVIVVQEDGIITTLNPEAIRALGLPKEKAINANMNDCDRLSPLWQKMKECMAQNNSIKRDEVTIVNAEGKSIPIGLSISLITGSENRFSGCAAVFKDLLEIRELETKLKHSERLSYLGKMASWVAHEIRNPLTAIDGFAQLLLSTKNSTDIERFSREIHKGSQRIDNIIEDILAFARTKRHVSRQPINIQMLLEAIINQISSVDVSIQGKDVPEVMGEPESIRRLFVNLINNGIEATQEHGRLDIHFWHDDAYVFIEITDNGEGIDPKNMKNLFVPFYTTKERGTGLGLSIVKMIVDEHCGKIDVTSRKGRGTTFRVLLPYKAHEEDVS